MRVNNQEENCPPIVPLPPTKSLLANGDLSSGKLFIKELALDSSAMDLVSQGEIDFVHQRIDLVVLVAPLKQVNWIVKHIPIIG
jgi:hypothetical protein